MFFECYYKMGMDCITMHWGSIVVYAKDEIDASDLARRFMRCGNRSRGRWIEITSVHPFY